MRRASLPRIAVSKRRRAVLAISVAGIALLGSPRASAQDVWGEVGNVLAGACQVSGGGTLAGIPLGPISKLDWLCDLKSLHSWVNTAILNGDWAGFAREVIGRYVTDFANHAANDLGLGAPGEWVNVAEDALKGSYRDFRAKLLNALRDALERARVTDHDDADTLPVVTAGRLAKHYADSNPMIAASEAAARASGTAATVDRLSQAFRAKKAEEQDLESIQGNLAPAAKKATQIIGAPTASGEADALVTRATTALSTREVAQVQVEALASLMKQNAIFQSAILNQLTEVARQGVLTNNQLAGEASSVAADTSAGLNATRAALEGVAEENLEAARGVASTIDATTRVVQKLFDPTLGESIDWAEYAP